VSAATATVGLILGLLIGAPVGFTYAVARRSRSDRDKAREQVKQYERDARGAARTSTAWIGIGVVVVVVTFACLFGAAGRNRAGPSACAAASRRPAAAASGSPGAASPGPDAGAAASPGPAAGAAVARRPVAGASGSPPPAAGRLAAAKVSATACRR
jgi:hypothetical protein